MNDQSTVNSATWVPSRWVPMEWAVKTTGSPVWTALSMAARMAAPPVKTKRASETAFLVNFAARPVTSDETLAPLCSMNQSAGAPVDISAAIACAAK